MKSIYNRKKGYTLIELVMVMAIVSILATVFLPRIDLMLSQSYQASSKGNLNQLRSGIALYYTASPGEWPLRGFPPGDTHYTMNGRSLYEELVPQFIPELLPIILRDYQNSFNGLATSFDDHSETAYSATPPKLAFILNGDPGPTPLLASIFVFDNQSGEIYISNGNLDSTGQPFYGW